MPGFQPPEGEVDVPNYASEQGMCLQVTCADYWSRHLMSNALKWGTGWSNADHFVPADRIQQIFRQLRPDLYHSHNFRDNSRFLILSEFQSQENISTVLRTSDPKANFCSSSNSREMNRPDTLRTAGPTADFSTLKTQK